MPSPLFPELPEIEPAPMAPQEAPVGAPRINRPERAEVKLRPVALDALLPEDHQARVVWAYVERLDLTAIESTVKSVEGRAGRAATDPHLLLALWLFATLDGVGSARQIERLCGEHLAYIWLRGDVEVGRTILAEFRVSHEELLDDLLTSSVAVLREQGLVTLQRVSQDGLRVRANAGAGSFRRQSRLEKALEEARERIEVLKRELESDPATSEHRHAAAKLRGAQSREKRVVAALEQMPEIERVWKRNEKRRAQRAKRNQRRKAAKAEGAEPEPPPAAPAPDRTAPRASMTDPDARVMKMANNGFRPAINCQIAADVDSMVIVAVDTVNVGADAGLHLPMIEEVQERYDALPDEWLVDGGFTSLETIDAMPIGCDLIAPVPATRAGKRGRYEPRKSDSERVAAWRARMGTEAGKATYLLRGATSECVNAHIRNRRLRQMPVRGKQKARCVLLLHALAHNLMRGEALRMKAAA